MQTGAVDTTRQAAHGSRICACGCGEDISWMRSQAKYLDSSHRYRAASKRRNPARPFIALDGEGIQSKYILLAASNGKWIGRKAGVTTEECLEFLLDLGRGSHGGTRPIYVWFAFDYDVNMILGDIPLRGENSIERLRESNTIYWRGYRITYLRRKILRIARGNRRHTSYDLWGFFQASFEKSLEEWGLEPDSIIKEGKAERTNFARWSLTRIRDYNNAELRQLAELAEKLRESIIPLELPIQSWHGPAALAAAWMRKNGVKNWLPIQETETDPEFEDACKRAYFGGRIDVLGYGIVEPVHHYDIVSAYPAATANLPDLSKLEWKYAKGKGIPRGRLYIAHIRWKMPPMYWMPFPWRAKDGSIRYSNEGEGWYWNYELETALEKYDPSGIEILEYFYADGEYEYPFRNLIRETFKYRGELKVAGHPSHKPVKLILNSLYGKFAQTVGRATYHNLIWAGLVTSQTRSQLMQVLSPDVVCVMTDSVWSRKPLDVPIGSGLGEWESQPETRLVLAEAGLYEATAPDGSKHVWQRGFDKRNPVDIERLVQTWLENDPSYKPSYSVNRFVGMGLALQTKQQWRTWIDIERAIEPVPFAGTTKRLPLYPLLGGNMGDSKLGNFVPLQPRSRDSQECSYPYSKVTLDTGLILTRLEDEMEEE